MRLLSIGLSAGAILAFAIVPASACSFGKTAKVKPKMTVADTAVIPQVETDVSIATNDLSDEVVSEKALLPIPGEKPAE